MVAIRERMASPGEARSIAALFLAAGARPDEIDGAVQTLIDQTRTRSIPPTTYAETAQQVIDALSAYRKTSDAVVEATK